MRWVAGGWRAATGESGTADENEMKKRDYCIDSLKRKLVIARLFQQNLQECDWSTVSKASLQSMSADAKENLEEIPDKCSSCPFPEKILRCRSTTVHQHYLSWT